MKGKIVSITPRSYEFQGSQRSTYDLILDIGEEKRTYSFNKGNALSVGQEIEFEEVKQGNYYRIQNIKGMVQDQKKPWGGKTPEQERKISRHVAFKGAIEIGGIRKLDDDEIIRLAEFYFEWLEK